MCCLLNNKINFDDVTLNAINLVADITKRIYKGEKEITIDTVWYSRTFVKALKAMLENIGKTVIVQSWYKATEVKPDLRNKTAKVLILDNIKDVYLDESKFKTIIRYNKK